MASRLGVSVEALHYACQYDETVFSQMEADGLLSFDADHIDVHTSGRPFVRCVAAALDPLMRHNDKQFSRPI